MESHLSLDGLVALVTGGGGFLGHAYCLELARRGASVIVNDLLPEGVDESKSPAQNVVNEINSIGGQAIAIHESVEFGHRIVDFAVKAFGTIHILIHNAGILRDASFAKMTDEQWDIVNLVHVRGVYSLTKAAWNIMMQQKFGRIIMTTSSSGLYGSFGQANYSAAKMAQVGLGFTLAKEGIKKNVLTNIIAPIAGSPLLATVIPPEVVGTLKAEYVAPLVAYLVSPENNVNGELFEVGAGWIARTRWCRSKGILFPLECAITAEMIQSEWDKIEDFSKDIEFPTLMSKVDVLMKNLKFARLNPEADEKDSLDTVEGSLNLHHSEI